MFQLPCPRRARRLWARRTTGKRSFNYRAREGHDATIGNRRDILFSFNYRAREGHDGTDYEFYSDIDVSTTVPAKGTTFALVVVIYAVAGFNYRAREGHDTVKKILNWQDKVSTTVPAKGTTE